MSLQWWPAPAKLNLFLHVTGRRADGYHSLQTLFQFLDYSDELAFELRSDGQILRATDLPGVPPSEDLCVRAALALQQAAGVGQGVQIHVRKRIPAGGGLGGASSDAATVLLVLNRLWELDLAPANLAEVGLGLGADVPVFIHGHAAWAEGVGERLEPVDLPESWYLLLNPGVGVATREIFAQPELTRNSPPITIRDFHAGRTRNDLEAVARHHYPQVDAALNWLAGFGPARMTGSGGCVFVPVADVAAGEAILHQCATQCPPEFSGFVARACNVHPLHAML